jgi:chromosome segregation ATPase
VADSDDNLEIRMGILEREVARLREEAVLTSSDAAAARVLAAGADHDVSEVRSELRAHTRALNALRETQLEQGQAITSIRQQLTGQGDAITSIRQELTEQGQAITSIRQELTEQGQAITSIRQELTEQGQAIVSLDQKMSAGFATLNTGMAQIAALLNGKA